MNFPRFNIDPRIQAALGLIITIITIISQVGFPPEVPTHVATLISDWDVWFLKVWTPVAAYLALSSSTSSGPLSSDHAAEQKGEIPPSLTTTK
jgi:hypothetical protein